MPARPRKKPEQAETTAESTLPNALRRATKRGFQRDTEPKEDAQTATDVESARQEVLRTLPGDDIASGRGLTYEWEIIAASLVNRVQTVEDAVDAGGSTGGLRYLHTQSVPSSSWNVPHNLATKPGVVVVSNAGQLLMAEVHYPDDNNTVIVFGTPFTGTAYLRG